MSNEIWIGSNGKYCAPRSMTEKGDTALAEVDDRLAGPGLLEAGECLVHGVPLGESSQIDLDSVSLELDRRNGRIEPDLPMADLRASFLEFGGGGNRALSTIKTPQPHDGPDGGIESAARSLRETDGLAQDFVGRIRKPKGSFGRLPVQPTELTVLAVEAHESVDRF